MKWNKKNHVLICLNASTARATIKPTLICALSKNIDSTKNGTQRSIKKSITIEKIWFVQLWLAFKCDSEEYKNLFAKCLQEQFHYQHDLVNTKFFWYHIHLIPSSKYGKEEELVEIPNHPNWTTFFRNLTNIDKSSRVITYINIRLISFQFLLCKDIFNHRDILCISFFNHSLVYFLINVYLDSLQSALKYLKDVEVDINNVLIMTSNFNIRDCSWSPNFCLHSTHKDTL